jgi:hypothetical protein
LGIEPQSLGWPTNAILFSSVISHTYIALKEQTVFMMNPDAEKKTVLYKALILKSY